MEDQDLMATMGCSWAGTGRIVVVWGNACDGMIGGRGVELVWNGNGARR